MRFNGLDLNLLVVLDALLTQRNLTAAAKRINLSQPAMSAAVSRLREYFRDELFTMNGRKLAPTPFAEALAPATRDALLHIQRTIASTGTFDPATSQRRFRIVLSDYMTIVFFNRIVNKAAKLAPHVTFELIPFDDQPDEPLHRGEVDLLIFPELHLSDAHPRVRLFEETLVCVAWRANKEINRRLTFAQYMSMGHVAAQFGPTRKPSIEDWFLLRYGLKRRIEVVVQSFSMLPHLVVGSNRIATMHSRLAEHYAKTMPLKILPLPKSLPVVAEGMQWPALHHNDPASLWLRELISAEAAHW